MFSYVYSPQGHLVPEISHEGSPDAAKHSIVYKWRLKYNEILAREGVIPHGLGNYRSTLIPQSHTF